MKPNTAILITGTVVAAVGVARIRQERRHHRDAVEIAVAGVQMDWLSQVVGNEELAKLWAPEDLSPEQYRHLMHANRQLCAVTLRDKLGLVTEEQRDFFASGLMQKKVVREYWDRFGELRAEEAAAARDGRLMAFTAVLGRAARKHAEAA